MTTIESRLAVTQETTAWIGLGANLGEPEAALRNALAGIGALPGTRVLRVSSLYLSAPVNAGGPDYLNAVAEITTTLVPLALLEALQTLEQAAGRERPYRNAPRTLDLDILLYGDLCLATTILTLPHPRMRERAFVLLPLAELEPKLVDKDWLVAVRAQHIERWKGASWRSGSIKVSYQKKRAVNTCG